MFVFKNRHKFPQKSGIYKILNRITNKTYVGSTINFKNRWVKHVCELRGGYHTNKILQNAYNKHGENNFYFLILEECPKNKIFLEKREQFYVDFYKSAFGGYNSVAIIGTLPKAAKQARKKIKTKMTKLNEAQVIEIRKRVLIEGESCVEVAKDFPEIAYSTLVNVKNGRKWKNVAVPKRVKKFKLIGVRGSKHKLAKLNEEQVIEIKKLLTEGHPIIPLAKKFNVKKRTIEAIKTGRSWKHIPWSGSLPNKIRNNILNENQVATIKELIVGNKISMKKIVLKYEVSYEAIMGIKHSRNWKHVPWPKMD